MTGMGQLISDGSPWQDLAELGQFAVPASVVITTVGGEPRHLVLAWLPASRRPWIG